MKNTSITHSTSTTTFNKASVIIALSVILGTVAYAWTGAPVGTPPANNVAAPINVGDTEQTKGGSVIFNGTYNPIRIVSSWTGYTLNTDGPSNHAEIANDTTSYNALMIAGNKSLDGINRLIKLYDNVIVNQDLTVNGDLCVKNRCISSFDDLVPLVPVTDLVQSYTIPGLYTFTVPNNYTNPANLSFEIAGGGGAAGGAAPACNPHCGCGGTSGAKGGSGGKTVVKLSLIPGDSVSVYVGDGGSIAGGGVYMSPGGGGGSSAIVYNSTPYIAGGGGAGGGGVSSCGFPAGMAGAGGGTIDGNQASGGGPTVYGYTKGGGYGWSGNASAGLINVGDPYSGAGGNNQTVGGSGKAYGTTTIGGGGAGSIVTPGDLPGNPGWVNVYYTH